MNKLIYLPASVIFILISIISCKQAPATQIINGIVYDASMNNITVISNQGDTINISTMNSNPEKVPGVLLNDSVQVTCTDEKIDGVQILKATELTITVHSPYYYIQGTWLEPNPINPKEMQGFTLHPNGTANSVNMATLLIKNWNLDNKTLTLQYESIGNRQTITGTDTLNIIKINADSLILAQKENIIWRLARQK
ncbi:lipocalin family protein [Bacteroides sp.]